jgi:hypothetical protein
MALTKVSYSLIDGACVNVNDFGAVCDKVTDDTQAVQAAIDYALANGIRGVEIPGMARITSPIYIDRNVADYPVPDAGKYFLIKSDNGGGLYYNAADGTSFTVISTRIPQTGVDPVSQFVLFDGLTIEASGGGPANGSWGIYVMDGNKFLRVRFHNCNILKIKYVNVSGGYYMQSHYFNHCNIRDWAGAFYTSLVWNFDIKFSTCIVEHSYSTGIDDGGFFIAKSPQACAITDNVIEGIQGPAISIYATKAIVISGNYMEDNGRDIDSRSSDPNYGIVVIGNSLKQILWAGPTIGAVSFGNNKPNAGTLHVMSAGADVLIKDSAPIGTVSDRFSTENNTFFQTAALIREGYSLGLDPADTKVFDFQLETGSTYFVTIRVNNASNLVDSNGLFMVARQGTGTLVTQVTPVLYFTVTVNGAYQIVVTNTDGSQRNCTVTALRIQ